MQHIRSGLNNIGAFYFGFAGFKCYANALKSGITSI